MSQRQPIAENVQPQAAQVGDRVPPYAETADRNLYVCEVEDKSITADRLGGAGHRLDGRRKKALTKRKEWVSPLFCE